MQGLKPEDYPPELTQFGPDIDAQSLFWKARRVQALVMQVRERHFFIAIPAAATKPACAACVALTLL